MKALSRLLLLMTAITIAGCVHQTRFYAPMQPDGWSAQPVSIACRFAPDADLDPATGTPVGDEGYYLYILIDFAGNRDYSSTLSFVFSFEKNPGGHSWIILESPQDRLEFGHNGNLGLEKPLYQDGVYQGFRDNHPWNSDIRSEKNKNFFWKLLVLNFGVLAGKCFKGASE